MVPVIVWFVFKSTNNFIVISFFNLASLRGSVADPLFYFKAF